MEKMISAEALKSSLQDDKSINGANLRRVIQHIEDAPEVEVVHAHWEDGYAVDSQGNIVYRSIDCSHCEEVFKIESETREYWKARFKGCPFCFAKMDGGNEDG